MTENLSVKSFNKSAFNSAINEYELSQSHASAKLSLRLGKNAYRQIFLSNLIINPE